MSYTDITAILDLEKLDLNSSEVLLLIAIARRANPKQGHKTWSSIQRLQKETRLSRNVIVDKRKSLVEKKYLIKIGERKGENGKIPVYKLSSKLFKSDSITSDTNVKVDSIRSDIDSIKSDTNDSIRSDTQNSNNEYIKNRERETNNLSQKTNSVPTDVNEQALSSFKNNSSKSGQPQPSKVNPLATRPPKEVNKDYAERLINDLEIKEIFEEKFKGTKANNIGVLRKILIKCANFHDRVLEKKDFVKWVRDEKIGSHISKNTNQNDAGERFVPSVEQTLELQKKRLKEQGDGKDALYEEFAKRMGEDNRFAGPGTFRVALTLHKLRPHELKIVQQIEN